MMKRIPAIILVLVLCVSLAACGGSSGKHYENAMQHIEAGERDEAIEELDQAIKADGDNPDLYLARGYAYLMPATGTVSLEDTYQRARADFEKALSLDANNEEAIKGLYYAELYRNNIEEAQKTIIDAIEGRDVSGELKAFVEDIKEGNIFDYNGKQRVKTGYTDGQLIYRMYVDYDAGGHISSVTSYNPDGSRIGTVDTVWNGSDYSTDYAMTSGGNLYRIERTYDEGGHRLTETFYTMDGAVDEENHYEYDENGNQTHLATYKNGSLIGESFTEYKYGSNGRVEALYDYDKDHTLMAYILYSYDEKTGKMLGEKCFNANDTLRWYTVNEYDEQGNHTRYAHYDADGNLDHEIVYGEG